MRKMNLKIISDNGSLNLSNLSLSLEELDGFSILENIANGR